MRVRSKLPILFALAVPAIAQPVAATVSPQGAAAKFMDYEAAAYGPRVLIGPAFSAAIRMANPPHYYPREWRSGGGAFARNYGDALAVQASGATGRYLAGQLLHEDFRYRPSGSTKPLARTFHAVAATFVDRSDSGAPRPAIANFVGAGAGGFTGNLYLPAGFNNATHAETRTAFVFAGFAAQNLLREFSPELRRVSRKLHLPVFNDRLPEWWVKR